MAVWTCADCTATYSVGAPACPQCGSVVRIDERPQPKEKEDSVAKVTVHGGPSDEYADQGAEDVASSETEPTSPGPDYDGMTLAELRDAATARDLPSSGTKAALIERLRET